VVLDDGRLLADIPVDLPPRGVRRAAPYAQLRARLLGLLGVEDVLAPA
jgi:sulfonate transport system ATP-binding protein